MRSPAEPRRKSAQGTLLHRVGIHIGIGVLAPAAVVLAGWRAGVIKPGAGPGAGAGVPGAHAGLALAAVSAHNGQSAPGQDAISQSAGQGALAFDRELTGTIRPGQAQTWTTPKLSVGATYSVNISLDSPSRLSTPEELVPRKIASPITFNVVKDDITAPAARVTVKFESAGNPAVSKGLNAGDPGTYFIVRAAQSGAARLSLAAADQPSATDAISYRIGLRELAAGDDALQIAPNTARDFQHASAMVLGHTVSGPRTTSSISITPTKARTAGSG